MLESNTFPSQQSKKPIFSKLYKFKSLENLDYDMMDYHEELINLIISRTDPSLIFFTKRKIFFAHPYFKRYGCDIYSNIFDLTEINQSRIIPFSDSIFIMCSLNEEYHEIEYSYSKFVREALKLYTSDKYKSDYESRLADEQNEKEEQLDHKESIQEHNKIINDILNHELTDDE